MERAYAQALWKMIEKGGSPSHAVKAIHTSLVTHGREALMPKVARAFGHLAQRELAKRTYTLSVARETDLRTAHKEALKALGTESPLVHTVVDTSLIGGWALTGSEVLIDHSYKKQLLDLYRRITA